MAGVIRGSHVTTIDGGRFCGADDNVGGFGNVLVTGRQTQANIFIKFYFCFLFVQSIQISVERKKRLTSVEYSNIQLFMACLNFYVEIRIGHSLHRFIH